MTRADANAVQSTDANAANIASPYPSLTIELNQQNTANSKAGLAISIVGGIMLLLGTRQQLPADLVWS